MNELLGVFTAFGVMVAGDKPVTGPLVCEKQINAKLEAMLLNDEYGRVSEDIVVDRREASPQVYNITYKVRQQDGTIRTHIYHVRADKGCDNIQAKRL